MALRERLFSLCSAFKYACCEPRAGDYDSCSDDGSIGKSGRVSREDSRCGRQEQQPRKQYQQQPQTIASSSETSLSVARYQRGREHDQLDLSEIGVTRPRSNKDFSDQVRSRHADFSDGAWVDSPYTDATRMVTPVMKGSSVANEEKTPMQDSRRGQNLVASRDRPTRGMPPRAPPKKRQAPRWTDDVLEGFLYSTLVGGSGLVLDKLDSKGKGKKCGERILSYDPDAMRLNWVSTGIRRKPGGMLVKVCSR
ncbi:unnamed protein product [Hapterophycus canaliculatus]